MKKNLSKVWNLDVFFPGGSASLEFQKFLDALEEDITSLEALVQSASVPTAVSEIGQLKEMVDRIQDLDARIRESLGFTECLTAQNVKDEKAKLLYGRVIQIYSTLSSVLIAFDRWVSQIPQATWEELLSHEELQEVAFPLHERRIRALEKLAPEQEILANDLAVDGYHSWSELYSSIVGRISIPVEKDGESKEYSVGQAANLMHHADRSVRSDVFAKWEEAWNDQAELISQALNHISGFRLNLYRHRGWESVLKEPLDMNRMSEQTLQVMWDVVSKNKGPMVAYLNRKAHLLGIEKLSWFDVYAPLGSGGGNVDYQQGAEFIVEQFRRFSPLMAEFAVKAFEERWIEAEDRPGKRPGGFCTSFGKSKQTRIFMTYAGTPSNVSTLAHELGHAYHDYVMRDMPELTKNYAMNVAETASTFAEMVVADAAVKQAKSEEEKLLLVEEKAQSCVSFLMDIYARFLFETRFYERRKKGLVSIEELNDLMLTAQKEAFGDALDVYHPLFWASKLHFYATEVPFYNFPYTFGYLFSYGVYARALEEGPAFEDKYVGLLRDTGRMTVEDLARKHLGVDLTKPDFWQTAVDLALNDVKLFLQLTEE